MSRIQEEVLECLKKGWRLHHSYHHEPGEVLCRPPENSQSRPFQVMLRTFNAMLKQTLIAFDGKVNEKCDRYRAA